MKVIIDITKYVRFETIDADHAYVTIHIEDVKISSAVPISNLKSALEKMTAK